MGRLEPDERTFRNHVAGGRFQQGVDRGDWRMIEDSWPNPVIVVAAASQQEAPDEVALRFTLTGYPNDAPTSEPWDAERATRLDHALWPAGGRVGMAFNPAWMPVADTHAIYIPMDRLALPGHDNWRNVDNAAIWDPSDMTIVDYLKVIHELLHSSEYSGIRRAA